MFNVIGQQFTKEIRDLGENAKINIHYEAENKICNKIRETQPAPRHTRLTKLMHFLFDKHFGGKDGEISNFRYAGQASWHVFTSTTVPKQCSQLF